MSFIPKAHEIYKHFKGNLYQIVAIAEHSETGEQLVVYQALYGDFKIYARPLAMFTGRVDKEKYPNVTQEYRFELQGADDVRQAERRTETATEKASAATEKSITESDLKKSDEAEAQNAAAQAELQNAADAAVQTESEQEELDLDPLLLEFLDADTYEQRLNILAGLHHRITDEMICTMAIACDVEVGEGDTEARYESLKNCLLTLERYECNRLR